MSADASVVLNGEERHVPAGQSVGELLASLLPELGLDPRQVAVEVNRELVPRRSWGEHRLAAGDRIELVTLVGGG